MKRLITLGAILAAVTLSMPAMADRGDRVDARQHHQQHRIEKGIRSGDITRHEARRLDRGQDRIDRMQRRARADGHVDRREQAHIRHEVARQDRHIRHSLHDRDRQYRGHDKAWKHGHRHAPAYGYSGHRPHRHAAPVVKRVHVDRDPHVSLILNW